MKTRTLSYSSILFCILLLYIRTYKLGFPDFFLKKEVW